MFKIIASALIFAVVSFTIGILSVYLRRHGEIQSSTLCPPRIIFWIGFVENAIFVIMDVVLCVVENWEDLLLSLIIGACLMPIGAWLMLYALNWRIIANEDDFVFRNSFGKNKTYKYEEITALKRIKIGGYRIFIGKKSIAVDYFISGRELLWDKIKVMDIPMKK